MTNLKTLSCRNRALVNFLIEKYNLTTKQALKEYSNVKDDLLVLNDRELNNFIEHELMFMFENREFKKIDKRIQNFIFTHGVEDSYFDRVKKHLTYKTHKAISPKQWYIDTIGMNDFIKVIIDNKLIDMVKVREYIKENKLYNDILKVDSLIGKTISGDTSFYIYRLA